MFDHKKWLKKISFIMDKKMKRMNNLKITYSMKRDKTCFKEGSVELITISPSPSFKL